MEYVPLGRTDVTVSRVAFGCAAIGGWDYGPVDDAESIAAVRSALDEGITLFDTADVYGFGHAEKVLGRALGEERARVTIATKCGIRWDTNGRTMRDLSPRHVRSAVESSLERLQLERIPLLQLHWPDERTPLDETLGAIERLREEGKVTHAGCCNFPFGLVRESQRYGRLESQQVPLSLMEREHEECAASCEREFGMSVLCYNVLAQGRLTGKYADDAVFPANDRRSRSRLFAGDVNEQAQAALAALRSRGLLSGRSIAQEAIAWLLEQRPSTIAVIGARHASQVRENARSLLGVVSAGPSPRAREIARNE